MQGNRRLIRWRRRALLALSMACALPVIAAEIPDEQESPALRKPLPMIAAPAAQEEDTVFSTEIPPPPPFDPKYHPPQPATVKEDEP